jgi:hypothetical protein
MVVQELSFILQKRLEIIFYDTWNSDQLLIQQFIRSDHRN